MAHGRQEDTFGLVGLLRLLARLDQINFQLLAFSDVDPAAEQALQLTIGAVERHCPLVGIGALALMLNTAINKHRFGVLQQT
ncbi:hypothetical protein D3C85_1559140 [compost metagenome]